VTGLGYTLPAAVAGDGRGDPRARRVPHGGVPPGGLLDLDGDRVLFQILVDGWLTKLSAPIVIYDEHYTMGIGFPSTSLWRISCSVGRW